MTESESAQTLLERLLSNSFGKHLGFLKKGWGLHFCPLDKRCRDVGAPARLHLRNNKVNIGIALTPNARFVRVTKESPYRIVGTQWISVRHHPK